MDRSNIGSGVMLSPAAASVVQIRSAIRRSAAGRATFG